MIEDKFMIVRSEYLGRRKKIIHKDLSKEDADKLLRMCHNTLNYYFTIIKQLIP